MATPHTIAVAGKGGVGKTTTCGMIIDYLCKKNKGPVLVVDADANANLNEVLGVEMETSLGQIREEIAHAELKGTIPKGMSKADYAEFKFNSALIEEDDFDMLVMGRTQGSGCYCFVNGMLKTQGDGLGQGHFAVELKCSFGQLIGFLHEETSLSINFTISVYHRAGRMKTGGYSKI